jgi:hypothetical protein
VIRQRLLEIEAVGVKPCNDRRQAALRLRWEAEVKRVLLALILMAATACNADDTPEASFAVADSAGVEVVTTTRPTWSDSGSPWRLTLEMEIGELEGAEPYLFGDPVSAVRLDDGRVSSQASRGLRAAASPPVCRPGRSTCSTGRPQSRGGCSHRVTRPL